MFSVYVGCWRCCCLVSKSTTERFRSKNSLCMHLKLENWTPNTSLAAAVASAFPVVATTTAAVDFVCTLHAGHSQNNQIKLRTLSNCILFKFNVVCGYWPATTVKQSSPCYKSPFGQTASEFTASDRHSSSQPAKLFWSSPSSLVVVFPVDLWTGTARENNTPASSVHCVPFSVIN